MKQAIAAVENGLMSKKRAAASYNIPKATLLRHWKHCN